VLCDHADYLPVLEELGRQEGTLSLSTRYRLAQRAFRLIANYDEAISRYFESTPLAAQRSIYSIRNSD
jgi:phosphoribosylaminoimidazolecarboxamide formyltransferase/IMP cyclohydrolase